MREPQSSALLVGQDLASKKFSLPPGLPPPARPSPEAGLRVCGRPRRGKGWFERRAPATNLRTTTAEMELPRAFSDEPLTSIFLISVLTAVLLWKLNKLRLAA